MTDDRCHTGMVHHRHNNVPIRTANLHAEGRQCDVLNTSAWARGRQSGQTLAKTESGVLHHVKVPVPVPVPVRHTVCQLEGLTECLSLNNDLHLSSVRTIPNLMHFLIIRCPFVPGSQAKLKGRNQTRRLFVPTTATLLRLRQRFISVSLLPILLRNLSRMLSWNDCALQ